VIIYEIISGPALDANKIGWERAIRETSVAFEITRLIGVPNVDLWDRLDVSLDEILFINGAT
jgi:hypothetical protein